MAQVAPMPMCPMAETCKGMMERPLSGLVMVIPGVVFIALGVSIFIWPSVLPWLVAIACILAGGAILLMVNFMRRIGARLRRAGD
jgi:protein-S-isoprenylcysteine O-methyltransferase Ste14